MKASLRIRHPLEQLREDRAECTFYNGFAGRVPRKIKRSLTSLAKAELIYDVGSGYKFVSPFFREWIRRRV